MTPSISSTPKALPLGKMIAFITMRVSTAISPRASPSQPPTGTHVNPALASCVWSTWWVTLGEQTRVICRECRRVRDRECGESRPATCAGYAPRLTVGRSTGRPEGSARQATKQAPHRSQAIEQRIGENPCEAGSWGVCLAFQSHFRILAWARLRLMPDLTREHGGLRSAHATRTEAPWCRMTDPAANTKWD